VNDIAIITEPIQGSYFGIGYPCSKQGEIDKNLEVLPKAVIYGGQTVRPDVYLQNGFDRNRHLLLEFDKKNVHGRIGPVTAPDMYGVSGGGVWRFDTLNGGIRDVLVAIFTEWHRGSKKFLAATRIDQVFEGIRAHFPELSSSLPRRRVQLI
jgi:hypothetical protein